MSSYDAATLFFLRVILGLSVPRPADHDTWRSPLEKEAPCDRINYQTLRNVEAQPAKTPDGSATRLSDFFLSNITTSIKFLLCAIPI